MGEVRPFSSRQSRIWLVIGIVLGALVIDQAIKLYIGTHYQTGETHEIFSWFWLCYVENNGMAFGIEWFSKLALTLFRLLAVGLLGWYIHTLIRKPEIQTGYIATIAFVIAGALGNIIDCVFYGTIFFTTGIFRSRKVMRMQSGMVRTVRRRIDGSEPKWIFTFSSRKFRGMKMNLCIR